MAKRKVLKGGEPIPDEIADDHDVGDQQHFDGMEPMPKNDKIHRLALRFKAKSLESSRAKAAADELSESVLDAMKEAGLERYHHGTVTIHADPKIKLKITVESAGKDE